jgi:zinc/manganese transport system substrate-binding protein
VSEIAEGLCDVSAEYCDTFMANASRYNEQIHALEHEIEAAFAAIPVSQRIVITGHDAFSYLARDYDLTMLAPQGLSTDSEASAAEVAELIDQIRETGARALFVETVSDPRLIAQIGDETGLTVSGTLYSDALSDLDGPAGTYLDMMRYNADAIIAALSGS